MTSTDGCSVGFSHYLLSGDSSILNHPCILLQKQAELARLCWIYYTRYVANIVNDENEHDGKLFASLVPPELDNDFSAITSSFKDHYSMDVFADEFRSVASCFVQLSDICQMNNTALFDMLETVGNIDKMRQIWHYVYIAFYSDHGHMRNIATQCYDFGECITYACFYREELDNVPNSMMLVTCSIQNGCKTVELSHLHYLPSAIFDNSMRITTPIAKGKMTDMMCRYALDIFSPDIIFCLSGIHVADEIDKIMEDCKYNKLSPKYDMELYEIYFVVNNVRITSDELVHASLCPRMNVGVVYAKN